MEHIENRSFLIIIPKKPFVEWVNSIEGDVLTEEDAFTDKTVYFVKEIMSNTEKNIKKLVEKNYKNIFKSELEEWYTDKSLWPTKKEMTIKLFNEWFKCDFVDAGKDLVRGEIIKSRAY